MDFLAAIIPKFTFYKVYRTSLKMKSWKIFKTNRSSKVLVHTSKAPNKHADMLSILRMHQAPKASYNPEH